MSANPNQDASGNEAVGAPKQARLPFEPGQAKKKLAKKPAVSPALQSTPASVIDRETPPRQQATSREARQGSIPEVVSRRMAGRMAMFSGIPTFLGMMTFVVSYLLVKNHIFKLPSAAVLLVSLGFFGLGVLGLTYGVLSASWDENEAGTWLGWKDFNVNFSRTVTSWQEARQQARSPQGNGNE